MSEIISTVVIVGLIAVAFGLAVRKLIKDKKNGKTCCGGGCDGCCGCEKKAYKPK